MNSPCLLAIAAAFWTAALPCLSAERKSLPIVKSGAERSYKCLFSPDGRYYIVSKYQDPSPVKSVTVGDLQTGKQYQLEYVGNAGIHFDPSSRYVILSCYQGYQKGKNLSERNITLLDLSTGKHQYIPSPSEVRPIFSPDGEHVIFMLESSAQFMLYHLGSRKILRDIRLPIGERSNKICWINEKQFALSMKGKLRIYNVADMSHKDFPWQEKTYSLLPIISPDGKHLAYSLVGQTKGEKESLRIHHVETGDNKQISDIGPLFYAFSPDSQKLYYAHGKSSYTHELATGKVTEHKWPREVLYADFSEDGRHVLVSTHAGLFHLSLETGKTHQINDYGGLAINSTFSPFDAVIAFSDEKDNCFCYNLETKKLKKLKMRGRGMDFSFLPDKKQLLGSDFDRTFVERID